MRGIHIEVIQTRQHTILSNFSKNGKQPKLSRDAVDGNGVLIFLILGSCKYVAVFCVVIVFKIACDASIGNTLPTPPPLPVSSKKTQVKTRDEIDAGNMLPHLDHNRDGKRNNKYNGCDVSMVPARFMSGN